MLQRLRAHTTGWIAKIILALLVFAFSFFGIESYFMTQIDNSAARVGDREVSQQDFQNRLNDIRRRASMQQTNLDPAVFATPEFKQNVLDGLINEQIVLQANEKLGVVVTGDMVASEIAKLPVFQLNGQFDADTYRAVLGQQGMSPLGFQERIRQELAVQVLPRAVAQSAIVTSDEVDRYLAMRDQTRDVRFVQLPEVAAADTKVEDTEVQTWYDAHQEQYMTPEKVSLAYLEVSADAVATDVQPSEEALRARYEKEKSRFSVPEQRLVSHILISVAQDAAPEAQKAALAEAESVRDELTAGADFVALAKQSSDDLGSSNQGGELGWLEKGMTNPAFEDAAFSLPAGTVSEPVLSPEGYHLILVQDIRPGSTKPFEEVRDELAQSLLESERERKYSEIAGRIADLIYANPSTLETAANTLGLTIKHTELFARDGGSGIAANPDVIETAFSEQVLTRGINSDPITISPNHMVVVRVSEHKPSTPKPLADVRDQVVQSILAERAANKASAQADTLLAKLKQNPGELAAIAESHGAMLVEKAELARFGSDVPPAVVDAIFKMPHPDAGATSTTAVQLTPTRYALVVLDSVKPGDSTTIPQAERDAVRGQLQQLHGMASEQAMIDALRSQIEVVINEETDQPS